jgi:hypothetical protein
MKHLFLLILIYVTSISINAQTGTVVNYVDNFGPITLTYNGLVNGKHSYRGTDPTPPSVVVTVRWTGTQWAIFINVNGGGDDLSFTSAVNTAINPPNFTIGMWVDVLPDPGGDGTSLVNLSGNGTTNTPLPVELVEFGAMKSGKSIVLNWMTASEVNNSGFDIERSIDGRSWKVIGFANGVGNVAEVQNYNFIDDQPFGGINYYRLKQIDYDGKYDYSPIVAVRNSNDIKHNVGPNPFNDFLTFTTNVAYSDQSIASIFNNQGSLIKEFGNLNGAVDTNDIPPGIYFIKFPSGEYIKLVKL